MGTISTLETKVMVRCQGNAVAYDKAKWFEVAKELKPGITAAEYDVMWDDFCKAKADHLRELNT
jgi:hypothetical protein